jgi:hypothetical protein
LVRPDRVSAQVTARAEGKPVEDLSQRDAMSQTFANPDGTWTSETSPEPVRIQDPGGQGPGDGSGAADVGRREGAGHDNTG